MQGKVNLPRSPVCLLLFSGCETCKPETTAPTHQAYVPHNRQQLTQSVHFKTSVAKPRAQPH